VAQDGRTSDRQSLDVPIAYAIADSVMHIHRERVGRGPTKAQAFFRRNVVVVVMEDSLTRGEKSLVASGRAPAARAIRAHFAQMMRDDLVAAVERHTGAAVISFLTDSSSDPDVSALVFLLDRPVPGDSPSGTGGMESVTRVPGLGVDGDGNGRLPGVSLPVDGDGNGRVRGVPPPVDGDGV